MAIYKRKRSGKLSESWYIRYLGGDGTWHREAVGSSYNLAKEVLAKRKAEVAERKHFPARFANNQSFKDVANKFWELHGSSLKSKCYRQKLDCMTEFFGDKKLSQINACDVQQFYNSIAAKRPPYSHSTANRYLGVLGTLFNKAKAWGDFYGDNPCPAVKKLREPQHRLQYLSKEDMNRLLKVASPRIYPVIVCAILTGMRRGEILGLKWENVDMTHGIIYLLETKSGKAREIPICDKLREILLKQGPKPQGPVFNLPQIALKRHFAKALARAGIDNFRFHDLRHTFASHFVMNTNDLPTLQRLLGHSKPTMTMRYAHLSKGHLKSQMAVFESGVSIPALESKADVSAVIQP